MRTLPLTYKTKRATKGLHGNVYKFPKKGAVLNQFGFNGQLKDNEIYGEGNAYTAEFWEYDPRSIRRWNRDPVVKPWRSPYDVLDNSTLWKIDPNGDDDYFNADGTYSHSTKTGTKVIIQSSEGNIEFGVMCITNAHDLKVVSNVVNYYAEKVGIKGEVGFNSTPDIPNSPANETGGNVFMNSSYKGDRSYFSDYNVIKNVLKHEKLHQQDKKGIEFYYEHAEVYLNQIKDDTFKEIKSNEFKMAIIGGFAQRVLNSYVQDPNTKEAYDLIGEFNKQKNGFQIVPDWNSTTSASTLTIVNTKTKESSTIIYKKIDAPSH